MQKLLEHFQPGRTIFVPGGAGEITALNEALAASPDRMRGVHVITTPIPGFNKFDFTALHPTARMTVSMLTDALKSAFDMGRVHLLPISHTAMSSYIGGVRIDLAIAHVSPPDDKNFCSLGVASDFTPSAWRNAATRALVMNKSMPAMKRGPRISTEDGDVLVEIDEPLLNAQKHIGDATADVIAANVAELIPNGATLQFGIGNAPAAVWAKLDYHRDLVIRSGQIGPGFQALDKAGALSTTRTHRTGLALGDRDFYKYLALGDPVAFAPVTETHGASEFYGIEKFIAINSALEVDLFGQSNLEWLGSRQVGGVGGAPDFVRAAAISPNGRSIIALPATSRNSNRSRIVGRLSAPAISLARHEADTVVTEFGIAELRSKSIDDRALALIAIAAPQWRSALEEEWMISRPNHHN
jgi:acyl-CoA hydrolase